MGQYNQDVRTIYEDTQHNIWVGYSGGIIVLNPLNMEIIRHYNTENSELHSDFVRSIAQDEKGRFWIGTLRRRTWRIHARSTTNQDLCPKGGLLFQYRQSDHTG